jgi:hypothetical protein
MLLSVHFNRTRFLSLFICCVISSLAGCQQKSDMVQVRGKVLYKDGSVPQGGVRVVRFEPAENTTAKVRKGASGDIGPDGSFTAWTRMPGDGVYAGEYNVTFAVWASPTDPNTSLLNPKYSSAATSGYKVTADHNIDDLQFEIEALPGAAKK